jgi:alpha-ketoglutarate-dependent taurine dioxygenase
MLTSVLATAPGQMPVCPAQEPPGRLDWLHRARPRLRELLAACGAVMIRGLEVRTPARAAEVSRALLTVPLEEREGFAPRETYAPGVYSSAHWPSDQPMCMHHELSYGARFPGLLVLCCLRAPREGGATTVADARRVLADLPADLTGDFTSAGWLMERYYSPLLGMSWQDAFGTADRTAVERRCREDGVAFRWSAEGGLHTRHHRAAVTRHPVTGERCWFNQVAFLSEWTMDPAVREFLRQQFAAEDCLPFSTALGDGRPVGPDAIALINDVYDRHTVREPWQDGDVMVIDNVLAAHALEPYRGPREVVVAMGEPLTARALGERP